MARHARSVGEGMRGPKDRRSLQELEEEGLERRVSGRGQSLGLVCLAVKGQGGEGEGLGLLPSSFPHPREMGQCLFVCSFVCLFVCLFGWISFFLSLSVASLPFSSLVPF